MGGVEVRKGKTEMKKRWIASMCESCHGENQKLTTIESLIEPLLMFL